MNRFDLSDKTAFVSGSSRGMGSAIAEGLGQHGARVVLNGRNALVVAGAVSELKNRGIGGPRLGLRRSARRRASSQ